MTGKSPLKSRPPRFASIDPHTGGDIRDRSVVEQYEHHRKQTRVHERSAQGLVDRLMRDQLREEFLRVKYPALQSAWDAYRVTLRMVDQHDNEEDRSEPIAMDEAEDSDDCSDSYDYDQRMKNALIGYRVGMGTPTKDTLPVPEGYSEKLDV